MRKVLILFILSTNAFLFCQATIDSLTRNPWGPERKGSGLYVVFKKDMTYEIKFAGEGGLNDLKGKYSLKGNTLELEPVSGRLDDVFSKLTVKRSFEYFIDRNSFYASECFRNDDIEARFYNQLSQPVDCEKTVDGRVIDFVAGKEGVVKRDAYVRTGPGKAYPNYVFSFNSEDESTPFLAAGYVVRVLGKTKEIETIGDLKGNWLYCDPGLGWYDLAYVSGDKVRKYSIEPRGWIFSPLVEVRAIKKK